MKITSSLTAAGSAMQTAFKASAAANVNTPQAPASTPLGPVSQAQQTLRALTDVDSQRVAELKAAIRQGTLDLDAGSLSRSMMDYYRR